MKSWPCSEGAALSVPAAGPAATLAGIAPVAAAGQSWDGSSTGALFASKFSFLSFFLFISRRPFFFLSFFHSCSPSSV